jgi:hypothetical protein
MKAFDCSALRSPASPPGLPGYQIRFRSLFDAGRALAFPCDASGQVPLDELSDRARHNYLYARAVVGREFYCPEVLPGDLH